MTRRPTKRCHWVPQAYLRAFAADEQRRKIWRLGRSEGEPELKPIEKVAVQFYLYVPMDAAGARDDSFEQKLADLEQWFGDAFWRELCTDFVDLSSEPTRKMIALLAATMFLRNPAQFARVRAMHGRLVDFYSAHDELPEAVEINGKVVQLDSSNWPAYRDAGEDDLKRMWIDEIHNATHYAKLFMAMRWSVLMAEEPVFITTDNPVTFVHPSLTFRGIKDPGTRIIFPISPQRVLVFDHLRHEPSNRYYPADGAAGLQNLMMWREANEHVFSSRHPDLVCEELTAEAERHGISDRDV